MDSIILTYALLDPIMTVARPAAAFFTAVTAGITENLFDREQKDVRPDRSCPVDGCCDGTDCPPEEHNAHHTFEEKVKVGCIYAFKDLWSDLAGWFLLGILLAGLIMAVIPPEMMTRHLGGGLQSMLIMMVIGIPLYICASASTPIAAALILKGLSPGAALVFLLAGPATNITSLTVLVGVLGKRATAVYLLVIAFCTVVSGLILDQVYYGLGISAQAIAGKAGELVPEVVKVAGALLLIAISVKPVYQKVKKGIVERKTRLLGCDMRFSPGTCLPMMGDPKGGLLGGTKKGHPTGP